MHSWGDDMANRQRRRYWRGTAAVAAAALVGSTLAVGASGASASSSKVLLVGTYHGKAGAYRTIQAAVDAASSGDWILIAPGDYHESDDAHGVTSTELGDGDHGGLVITKSDLHLRGMDRDTVIVDGTKPGAANPCSSAPEFQNYGPVVKGKAQGRNGIVVWKADHVSIENLTACNFLAGPSDSGNQIWWNGGDNSATIGLTGYTGDYLTGTSTFFSSESTAAQYGIFSSNSAGPASWDQIYGSNMNDSGMYVGACQQVCDVTIDHAWMENNALGYSGTNSGGAVVIENSQFDNNEDGADTNTQIDGDPPAPQNGACPHNGISPITHTHSCWVFIHNDVHDNNNPNAPEAGSAAAGPIGTGMTVSGARNVTLMDNTFSNNGAWGTLFVPYPDSGKPVDGQTCQGTGGFEIKGFGCVYEPEGDALLDNTYTNDGFFGNPDNVDFGQITLNAGIPGDCFAGNNAPLGSAPAGLELLQPVCGLKTGVADSGGALLGQVLCDTGFGTCPAGATYPKSTGVQLERFPEGLPTMPDPCHGVPANTWCPKGKAGSALSSGRHTGTAIHSTPAAAGGPARSRQPD
jgi:hypothetical protein